MNLGKVVGTVVATRKESSMDGLKFMLVKHVDTEGGQPGVLIRLVCTGIGMALDRWQCLDCCVRRA